MITIFNNKYTSKNSDFTKKLESIPYFSYKYNFETIKYSVLNSDIGWGCTYRCGQMLLCLVLNKLNNENNSFLFDDTLSRPFSIHKMVEAVCEIYNYNIGVWLGPCTLSYTLEKIVENYKNKSASTFDRKKNNIILPNIYIAKDSIIYKNELKNTPTIILVPLRLGLNYLNPVYTKILFKILDHRLCTGIVSGKPNSSYYIIGHDEKDFLYLDPHVDSNKDYYINTSRLDSSLLLSFLCCNSVDIDLLEMFIEKLQLDSPYIFTFKDVNSNCNIKDMDTDFESINDF